MVDDDGEEYRDDEDRHERCQELRISRHGCLEVPISRGPRDRPTRRKLGLREVNSPIQGRTSTADLSSNLDPFRSGTLNLHWRGAGDES